MSPFGPKTLHLSAAALALLPLRRRLSRCFFDGDFRLAGALARQGRGLGGVENLDTLVKPFQNLIHFLINLCLCLAEGVVLDHGTTIRTGEVVVVRHGVEWKDRGVEQLIRPSDRSTEWLSSMSKFPSCLTAITNLISSVFSLINLSLPVSLVNRRVFDINFFRADTGINSHTV